MVTHALTLWGGSAAVLWLGLQWASEPVALAVHGVFVVVWAAVVASVWFTRFGRRGPVDTAAVFGGGTLVADFALWAFAARGGIEIVDNVAGVAIPLVVAGLVVFAIGMLVNVDHTVRVHGVVDGFQPEVFAALVEPELIQMHPAVRGLSATTDGEPVAFGPGCERTIERADGDFMERVVAWDPPRELQLEVVSSTTRLQRMHSTLRLQRVDEGVIVDWTARFRIVAFPLSGWVGRRRARDLAAELASYIDGLNSVIAEARASETDRRNWKISA